MSDCDKVVRAVSRGYRTSAAIAEATGLPRVAVTTYLTRLKRRGLIEPRKVSGSRAGWKEYHQVGVRCLLADVWK